MSESVLPAAASVVVIGAGQAGLSVAYYLQKAGLRPDEDFVVIDRGPSSGGAWQHRWESLRLGDTHRVYDLPGMDRMGLSFRDADADRPARDVVVEYYERFEQHYGLRVAHGVVVDRVEHAPDGFIVRTTRVSDGTRQVIAARLIVNASGTWERPRVPDVPGRASFAGRQVTTSEYRSAAEFRGLRVAVVGGGTSAIGFLVELDGVAAQTYWFTRRPVVFGESEDEVGMEARLAAVERQNLAARAGLVLPSIVGGTGLVLTTRTRSLYERGLLRDRPMFDAVEPNGVRLEGGEFLPVDAIIWATGFSAELDHLEPLGLREPGGGVRVEDGRVVADPRVFLAGYGPQASTIGANRAGRATARQVLAALQDTPARARPA